MLKCNWTPALLAKWLGSLHATAVTRGWCTHWKKVSTERRKFSCREVKLRPFHHKSSILPTELSRLIQAQSVTQIISGQTAQGSKLFVQNETQPQKHIPIWIMLQNTLLCFCQSECECIFTMYSTILYCAVVSLNVNVWLPCIPPYFTALLLVWPWLCVYHLFHHTLLCHCQSERECVFTIYSTILYCVIASLNMNVCLPCIPPPVFSALQLCEGHMVLFLTQQAVHPTCEERVHCSVISANATQHRNFLRKKWPILKWKIKGLIQKLVIWLQHHFIAIVFKKQIWLHAHH